MKEGDFPRIGDKLYCPGLWAGKAEYLGPDTRLEWEYHVFTLGPKGPRYSLGTETVRHSCHRTIPRARRKRR